MRFSTNATRTEHATAKDLLTTSPRQTLSSKMRLLLIRKSLNEKRFYADRSYRLLLTQSGGTVRASFLPLKRSVLRIFHRRHVHALLQAKKEKIFTMIWNESFDSCRQQGKTFAVATKQRCTMRWNCLQASSGGSGLPH